MSEYKMKQFVQDLFESTDDLGTLTLKIVRQKYLLHSGLESLEKEEKLQLKIIVTDLALEHQERNRKKQSKTSTENQANGKSEGNKTKRKHVSSVSADSQEDEISKKPKAKRQKGKESLANNKHKSAEKAKKSSKVNKTHSPNKDSVSPRKKNKPPKARKRLSSGDVRDAILEDDIDKADENVMKDSSSSDSELRNVTSDTASPVVRKKKQKSKSVFDPSSASEYGSPFKDDTPVVKAKKSKNKTKKLIDSESEVSDTEVANSGENSKVESGDKDNGSVSDNSAEPDTEMYPECSDDELNISDPKSVTVSFSYDGEKAEILSGKDSDSDYEKKWMKKKKKKRVVWKRHSKVSKKRKRDEVSSDDTDSELDDEPLKKSSKTKAKSSQKVEKKRKLVKSDSDFDSSDSDLDKPLKKKNAPGNHVHTTDNSGNENRDSAKMKDNTPETNVNNQTSDTSDNFQKLSSNMSMSNGVAKDVTENESASKSVSSDSESDDGDLAVKKKKLNSRDGDTSDTSVHDSGDEESKTKVTAKVMKNVNNNNLKGKQKNNKTVVKEKDDDTSDTSINDSDTESVKRDSTAQKNNTKTKSEAKKAKGAKKTAENKDPTKTSNVIRLEKIARHIKAMPVGKKYTQYFEGCDTARKRENKLKALLVQAGMEGNPSMEKAEALKLKKEAQELDSKNILSESGRGKRRNAKNSMFTTDTDQKPPVQICTPIKEKFRGLKGIIDSEGSESD